MADIALGQGYQGGLNHGQNYFRVELQGRSQ
jgi:hypothetical protein